MSLFGQTYKAEKMKAIPIYEYAWPSFFTYTYAYIIVQCKKRVKHERTFVIEKDHVCISNKANYLLLI